MSPGLVNTDFYTVLAPMMQLQLRQLGIPLVVQAPGVEVADDGIHWRITSSAAIAKLVDVFVECAANTSMFKEAGTPTLWQRL